MNEKTLSQKVRELKELKTLQDELSAEIAAIEDEIKAYMTANEKEEISVDVFKVRYKVVTSQRLNTAAIKAELPEVYSKYTKITSCRRFTVA